MSKPLAIFCVNLVQDVAMLRPLVIMATRDMGFAARILVSPQFEGRDRQGIWSRELDSLLRDSGASLHDYGDPLGAFELMDGGGLLFSASESHLPNHAETHALMRIAPPNFLRVTLQHGFECVGFRHSAQHDEVHGRTVRFAADIIAGWAEKEFLPSLAPSQSRKLLATGPSSLLHLDPGASPVENGDVLVCENLHSVRFRQTETTRNHFPAHFAKLCLALREEGRKVALRPHPGGQYFLRKALPLANNARIAMNPIYRGGLQGFACGISAPSSVIIDMLMAQIPTALWVEKDSDLDVSGLSGLPQVDSAGEWLDFVHEASADPTPFLALQNRFLEKSGIILDRDLAYRRFAEIFASGRRLAGTMS